MPLSKSKIGYDGEHFGWNPGGAACSNKCDGCWSLAKVGPRMKCQKCRDNIVHLHEERLGDPASRKKPATILVNFTCDTFDKQRHCADIHKMLLAAMAAPQHTNIFLTKSAWRIAEWAKLYDHARHFYWGLSIRNQADADAKLPIFFQIPGKLWLSLEPLWGPVEMGLMWHMNQDIARREQCRGVIVGHDNRRGAPGTDTLEHIESVVVQCLAADVKIYVKQIWIDGKLRTDPQYFPEDLRMRHLPWGEKEQGNG